MNSLMLYPCSKSVFPISQGVSQVAFVLVGLIMCSVEGNRVWTVKVMPRICYSEEQSDIRILPIVCKNAPETSLKTQFSALFILRLTKGKNAYVSTTEHISNFLLCPESPCLLMYLLQITASRDWSKIPFFPSSKYIGFRFKSLGNWKEAMPPSAPKRIAVPTLSLSNHCLGRLIG